MASWVSLLGFLPHLGGRSTCAPAFLVDQKLLPQVHQLEKSHDGRTKVGGSLGWSEQALTV